MHFQLQKMFTKKKDLVKILLKFHIQIIILYNKLTIIFNIMIMALFVIRIINSSIFKIKMVYHYINRAVLSIIKLANLSMKNI
jgi:hypothetical protein